MTKSVTTTKEAVAREDDKNENSKHLLDKDWGARIPEYVSKGCVSTAVFIMGITMRGDWLLFLAHYWRSQEDFVPNPKVSSSKNNTELADWMEERFQGFWPTYFLAATAVSYLFFFGIGGYLHLTYYVGKKDSPHEWKCQPNKWLSSKEEIHEIIVGWFSLTIGSALSAALATWVMNGGYTSIYYDFGKHGLLWSLLELPIVFVTTDYVTYWLHRIYHMPFLYKHFHKLHHTYKQPTAFSVTAIHPVEFLNIQCVYIAPMFLMPIYAPLYCGYLMYIYYHGIIDHSGIAFKRLWFQPWQPDCIFHDNHHQYFHVNFGFNVELWDEIHGTARQKDRIYREDIFWGKGKEVANATRDELEADIGERKDENPLAYDSNKNKYL
eukprot:TRINITY_DN6170_c0_g1_i1.p1 TRINITY_DN6170_c0_g1~~TRINITY_DN6170_c0_g1_i1.p1  ORF type:complete len:380 (+),score=74.40 TRINITY_DN6170_c0_g1_i1:118-1257(+)